MLTAPAHSFPLQNSRKHKANEGQDRHGGGSQTIPSSKVVSELLDNSIISLSKLGFSDKYLDLFINDLKMHIRRLNFPL